MGRGCAEGLVSAAAAAVLAAPEAVAVFAVVACGWPQFGGEGGRHHRHGARLPILLALALARVRITARRG